MLMYVRINGVPVGIWGPEAVMFIGRKIVHAIGASKGWAGQGSGSGTWLGERGRQSSQRGRQRQRKTGRAVGVGVLRNQTSHVCGDQRCKHEIPRRGAGAGSNSLPCRDMGCDPSDAGAYMCLADIAAEGRVPDVRTHMHACFKTFFGSTGIVGLAFGLGADTWVSGPRVTRVLDPLGTVGDWNRIRRRQRAEECVCLEREEISCSFPNTRCLARPGSGTRTSQMPGGCQGPNVGTMQNPRSTCVREAATRIWQV